MEEEEQLHHDLRDFTDRGFLRSFLRSSLPFWLLLGLSFLLNLFLSSLALARVSGLSSQLRELKPQRELNFSNRDSLLFPCGPNSRDWEYFHGKCYYFSLGKSSWERARSQCRELGAQLAVIDSFPEQVLLPDPKSHIPDPKSTSQIPVLDPNPCPKSLIPILIPNPPRIQCRELGAQLAVIDSFPEQVLLPDPKSTSRSQIPDPDPKFLTLIPNSYP
ncbi:hepatic lectin-like isoform X3 [Myiozetetes cayanensis]|uniref:hepatic lectin-like isoform X3 n=1 Tax=Myiozetetes cayanensis TaxID=478635 RepID=UPI00215EFAD5|nr:hepatic lectin-like isoform X3 [Myiozetetes cayanensis]